MTIVELLHLYEFHTLLNYTSAFNLHIHTKAKAV